MTGFSSAWLELREPADLRARDSTLAKLVAADLAVNDCVRIVDLGCGTGSNLRALAPLLNQVQHWLLVDHDADLLRAARLALTAWADVATDDGALLHLRKGAKSVTVSLRHTNLATEMATLLDPRPDLITASALFDLVSVSYIDEIAARIGRIGSAFYTVLTYDGRQSWGPAHSTDADILAAFNRHQTQDKGFGAAAGAGAVARLRQSFARVGYMSVCAASPWRLLAPDDGPLIAALAVGVAEAVSEMGADPTGWLAAHRTAASTIIDHSDFYAARPG